MRVTETLILSANLDAYYDLHLYIVVRPFIFCSSKTESHGILSADWLQDDAKHILRGENAFDQYQLLVDRTPMPCQCFHCIFQISFNV